MSGTPILASDIPEVIIETPPFVYDCFNELIQKRYRNGLAKIFKIEVINAIRKCTDSPFEYEWLDIEPQYRKSGWDVTYHSDLTGREAFFMFRKAQ